MAPRSLQSPVARLWRAPRSPGQGRATCGRTVVQGTVPAPARVGPLRAVFAGALAGGPFAGHAATQCGGGRPGAAALRVWGTQGAASAAGWSFPGSAPLCLPRASPPEGCGPGFTGLGVPGAWPECRGPGPPPLPTCSVPLPGAAGSRGRRVAPPIPLPGAAHRPRSARATSPQGTSRAPRGPCGHLHKDVHVLPKAEALTSHVIADTLSAEAQCAHTHYVQTIRIMAFVEADSWGSAWPHSLAPSGGGPVGSAAAQHAVSPKASVLASPRRAAAFCCRSTGLEGYGV